MTDVWSPRAEAYHRSAEHRAGEDLDLIVAWCIDARTALDVGSGAGHVARRLRAAGLDVVTSDPSPGMRADVLGPAEHLPFADSCFDAVVTRIAAHHFADVRRAVAELARVARQLVIVEDTLFTSEAVEEAERLRDPSHVRSYSESEWRGLLEAAGLEIEEVRLVRKRHVFDDWLARTGCTGGEADRVRELLAELTEPGGEAWTDTKILLRARKETS